MKINKNSRVRSPGDRSPVTGRHGRNWVKQGFSGSCKCFIQKLLS